jgi:hypothetical protein
MSSIDFRGSERQQKKVNQCWVFGGSIVAPPCLQVRADPLTQAGKLDDTSQWQAAHDCGSEQQNDEVCGVKSDYLGGETCPKVFHLKYRSREGLTKLID